LSEAAWERLGHAHGTVSLPAEKSFRLKITISDTASTDLSSLALLQPNDLQSLRLEYTTTTGEEMAYLQGLTGLWELDLKATPVTDSGLKHVRPLTGLVELGLWETRVTDTGLTSL